MLEKTKNFLLRLKYVFCKNRQKKHDFGTPTFVEDFNNPKFKINHLEWYWQDMITHQDNVVIKDNALQLLCNYEDKEFSGWWGTAHKKWSIGMINYQGTELSQKYGTWSIKCRIPSEFDDFPAMWLLRERHARKETKVYLGEPVKLISPDTIKLSQWNPERIDLNWFIWINDETIGFVKNFNKDEMTLTMDKNFPSDIVNNEYNIFISPDHIIPEVDVMEVIYGRLQHTLHSGYSVMKYSLGGWHNKIWPPKKNKIYEFSVTIEPTGYKFFIDGILTGVCTKEETISDIPAYLILNNAKNKKSKTTSTVFEIYEIKYYKP